MEIIENLLSEKGSDLAEALVGKAGFSASEASSFLPPAVQGIFDAVGGGGVDLGQLLGGGDPQDVLGKLDLSGLAGQSGVDGPKAQSGLQAILPVILSFLQGSDGGIEGALSLLGGGSEGGTAGALGQLAGKLFNR